MRNDFQFHNIFNSDVHLLREDHTIFLFDSLIAAKEASFMLRGQWDNCNGISIHKPDNVAIQTVAKLLEVEFCCSGDFCFLVKSVKEALFAKTRAGKSVLMSRIIAEAIAEGWPTVRFDLPDA